MSSIARYRGCRAIRRPSARAAAADKASLTTWIAVLAGMIGAFMAILNIQITNASLLDIEGGIGTGVDNGAWISTVLSDRRDHRHSADRLSQPGVLVPPLPARQRGRCSRCSRSPAPSRTTCRSMIVLRGLQGFAGGVLIPMAFTIVLTMLPKAQQPIGLALFALVRDLRARRSARPSAAISPRTTAGRRSSSSTWCPSAVMVVGARADAGAPADAARPAARKATGPASPPWRSGSSALQTVLEEGNKDDWFGSPFIVRLAIVAAVFAWRCSSAIELTVEKPLVSLRLLTRRNFGFGVMANRPARLRAVRLGLSPAAISRPGAGLQRRADRRGAGLDRPAATRADPARAAADEALRRARYIAVVGIGVVRRELLHEHHAVADYRRRPVLVPNIVRAIGQALVLTPLSAITTAGIAPSEAGAASGLSNMLRNLGGAIGTATLATFFTKREQFHSNIIGQSVTLYSEETRQRIAELTTISWRMDGRTTSPRSTRRSWRSATSCNRQALIMAFSDTFAVIGVVLAVAAIALLFARKSQRRAQGRQAAIDGAPCGQRASSRRRDP